MSIEKFFLYVQKNRPFQQNIENKSVFFYQIKPKSEQDLQDD